MFMTPAQPHNSLNNINSKKNTSSNKTKKRLPLLKNTASDTRKNLKSRTRKSDGALNPNVPKQTVLLEMKLQKTIRKNADDKLQSNEEHTKNLLQTKQMLADILKEYDHISKDKTILTAEIRNMKKYLSEIRLKLDQSLLVLNKNTTLFAATKKGLMQKIILGKKKSTSLKAKRSKKSKKIAIDQIEPIIESILTS